MPLRSYHGMMHRALFFTIVAVLLCLMPGHAAGAPPLTEPQRRMLAETGDTLSQPAEQSEGGDEAPPIPMPLEQPGLYALLNNAMAWEPGDEGGATLPNYEALYESPVEHRGEVILIEGELKRAATMEVGRSGPWGQRITEWIVEVGRDPLDSVVVLLPDPEGEAAQAKPGTAVRVPARFYMAQRVELVRGGGRWGVFLTFVGPPPEEIGSPAGGSPWLQPLLIFALVFLGMAILYILRKAMSPQPRPLQRRHREHAAQRREPAQQQEPDEPEADPGEPLPEDPVEAMGKLFERDEEAGAGERANGLR